MFTFKTHSYFVFSRKEFWFYNGEQVKLSGYNSFSAATKVCEGKKVLEERYETTVIDLTRSADQLSENIHPTFRYDIRQAEKTNPEYRLILQPTNKDCEELVKGYNLFAKEMKLPAKDVSYFRSLRVSGGLHISLVSIQGQEVVKHIYINDGSVVLLMSSFHDVSYTDTKRRSELNKWLHWKDILSYKDLNLVSYDFGGINQQKLPGISKFKMGFGGEIVERYRYSIVSPLLFFIFKVYKKFKANGTK